MDGAKGEKGESGERGPSGLPVSVMSLFLSLKMLIPITVMPLNPFLFRAGASWPTGPYWAARNQRRKGNHRPLIPTPTNHGCTSMVSLSPRVSTPASRCSQSSGSWTIHRVELHSSCAPSTSFLVPAHLFFVSPQGRPGEPGLDVSISPFTVIRSLLCAASAAMLNVQ